MRAPVYSVTIHARPTDTGYIRWWMVYLDGNFIGALRVGADDKCYRVGSVPCWVNISDMMMTEPDSWFSYGWHRDKRLATLDKVISRRTAILDCLAQSMDLYATAEANNCSPLHVATIYEESKTRNDPFT